MWYLKGFYWLNKDVDVGRVSDGVIVRSQWHAICVLTAKSQFPARTKYWQLHNGF